MTVTTNGPIILTVDTQSKTSVLPPILFQWVYGEVDGAIRKMREDGLAKGVVESWIMKTTTDELRSIESRMSANERRRFHIALFTCLDPEDALNILWATTVHRMMGASTLAKVEELVNTVKSKNQTTLDAIEMLVSQYHDSVLRDVFQEDDDERQELEDRRKEVERLETNLSERIAAWNKERKMAEKELQVLEPNDEYDELYEKYVALDYQSTLLREVLKSLL